MTARLFRGQADAEAAAGAGLRREGGGVQRMGAHLLRHPAQLHAPLRRRVRRQSRQLSSLCYSVCFAAWLPGWDRVKTRLRFFFFCVCLACITSKS